MFTSANSMMEALVIFISCQIMAVLFALVGGAIIDVFYNAMVNSGWMDISGPFGNFDPVNIVIGLYYLFCTFICLYGIFILALTIYHKYVLDEEEDEDAVYTGDDY